MFEKIMQNPGMVWDSETGKMAEKKGVKWKEVFTFREAEELFLWSKFTGEWIGISYQDGAFAIYQDPGKVYALFLGETKFIRDQGPTRVPQMSWNGVVCTSWKDYMELYDVPHNYLTRARMLFWLNYYRGGEPEEIELPEKFIPNKVVSFEPWTNHFKKPSVVLKYEGLYPLFGLKQIRETFPKEPKSTWSRLYTRNRIPLPYELKR